MLNIFKPLLIIIYIWTASAFAQQAIPPTANPRPLTAEELRSLRLQKEKARSQDVKNFIQTMLQKDFADINAAHQKQINKMRATLEQIETEKQNTFRQQNEEIKNRYYEFFKKVTQNLPQKGRHQNYSAYNQQFNKKIKRR